MTDPFQRQGLTSETNAMQAEFQNRQEDHASQHGSDHENENRRETKADEKKKKQGRARYRIQAKNLRDPKKGLRLFYGSIGKLKLDQVDNRNETDILNQFLRLYKEWHFNLASKYDLNYFISRCQDFGREPDIRTYLQRMRSVHIGLNRWEDFADEEDEFEEEKKNDQATQNTQLIPETQNSGLSLEQLYRAQAGQNPQTNPRSWTSQAYQLNRNSVNNTPNKNAMNMNMNNQNQRLLRDTTNQIAGMQQSSAHKPSENQRGPTQQERDEYEELDRILEEERKDQREVAEDDFVDMGDDFGMGDNFDEPEPDYKDPFDPDDEQPLDEKDLEYPIKKLKI